MLSRIIFASVILLTLPLIFEFTAIFFIRKNFKRHRHFKEVSRRISAEIISIEKSLIVSLRGIRQGYALTLYAENGEEYTIGATKRKAKRFKIGDRIDIIITDDKDKAIPASNGCDQYTANVIGWSVLAVLILGVIAYVVYIIYYATNH